MEKLDVIMIMTHDPLHDVPAATTLLYKVCDNNPQKFEEACRLVSLFMKEAQEKKDV